MAINHRQIEMYRGDAADLPQVLGELHRKFGGHSDLLRIAKVNQQIVAGYALASPTEQLDYFELAWIGVLPDFRRQAVGRWVAGHAMGVAESKSGRGLWARCGEPVKFFQGLGFAVLPNGGFVVEFFPE